MALAATQQSPVRRNGQTKGSAKARARDSGQTRFLIMWGSTEFRMRRLGQIGGFMKKVNLLPLIGAAVLILFGKASAGGDPSVFGATPAVSEVQISPDGSTLAMLRAVDNSMSVVFYDLDNLGARPAGIQVGGGKARDIVWADNDHVLVLASQTGRMKTVTGLETIEFFRWFSISRSTMKSIVLFGNEGNLYIPSAGALVSILPDDPRNALFARYNTQKASNASVDLLKANLTTSDTKLAAGGRPDTYDWLVTSGGEPLARIDYDQLKKETILNIRDQGDSTFRKVKVYPDAPGSVGGITFYGQGEDGSSLIAAVRDNRGSRSIAKVDKNTGDLVETLFANADYDIDGVSYDYGKATATGARFTDDLPRAVYFDPDDQKIQNSLGKALPGAAPMIVSKSADNLKMIVRAIYTDNPDQFFFYDRGAKSMSQIATTYPALDAKSVAVKSKFDYVSTDGLTIHGYLTLPSGAEKKNMPLIVLPHGGPAGRDDMSFDWWSFFYAANGYLVYQPNFRGSDGYGADFLAAGFGEWGRKMQDDITNGVQKLVADGIVDAKRICIVGGSYGGYAALAGATLTPDLYACAVSVNGVSDLSAMIGRSARNSDFAEDYWDVRLGSRFRDAEALKAVSPAKIADRAGAPIMLIHGRDDTIVPFSHSLKMYDAVKAAKKPVELVELKGEDHWLSRSPSRIATLEKSLEFINRHIGHRP